jgi:hypothetical protein
MLVVAGIGDPGREWLQADSAGGQHAGQSEQNRRAPAFLVNFAPPFP